MLALPREWGKNNERHSPSGTIQECSNLHGHVNPKEVDYAVPARKWRRQSLLICINHKAGRQRRLKGSQRMPGVAAFPQIQYSFVAKCLLTQPI